jgi:hypothetical protein
MVSQSLPGFFFVFIVTLRGDITRAGRITGIRGIYFQVFFDPCDAGIIILSGRDEF